VFIGAKSVYPDFDTINSRKKYGNRVSESNYRNLKILTHYVGTPSFHIDP